MTLAARIRQMLFFPITLHHRRRGGGMRVTWDRAIMSLVQIARSYLCTRCAQQAALANMPRLSFLLGMTPGLSITVANTLLSAMVTRCKHVNCLQNTTTWCQDGRRADLNISPPSTWVHVAHWAGAWWRELVMICTGTVVKRNLVEIEGDTDGRLQPRHCKKYQQGPISGCGNHVWLINRLC